MMKRGATDNFLAAATFCAIFSLLMLSGSMLYAILTGIDNGTDIYQTADSTTAQDEFDPGVLAAPAAGTPGGNRSSTYNCKDMIYQISDNGIKYIREYGGVYNAAIVNEQFGLYELGYGHLQPVALTVLDQASIMKLRYALEKCNEFYIRSGAQFITGTVTPGPLT